MGLVKEDQFIFTQGLRGSLRALREGPTFLSFIWSQRRTAELSWDALLDMQITNISAIIETAVCLFLDTPSQSASNRAYCLSLHLIYSEIQMICGEAMIPTVVSVCDQMISCIVWMCCPLWTIGGTATQLASDLWIVPQLRHACRGRLLSDSSVQVSCRLSCCLLLRLHQYLIARMPHRKKKKKKTLFILKRGIQLADIKRSWIDGHWRSVIRTQFTEAP